MELKPVVHAFIAVFLILVLVLAVVLTLALFLFEASEPSGFIVLQGTGVI